MKNIVLFIKQVDWNGKIQKNLTQKNGLKIFAYNGMQPIV